MTEPREGARTDLPELPLPSIDLPSIELPGCVKAILVTKAIWLPILIGIALAEWQKRRARGAADRADGTP